MRASAATVDFVIAGVVRVSSVKLLLALLIIGWVLTVTVPEPHRFSVPHPASHPHVGAAALLAELVPDHSHIGSADGIHTPHGTVLTTAVVPRIDGPVAPIVLSVLMVAVVALAGLAFATAAGGRGPPPTSASDIGGKAILIRFGIARR